MRTPGNGQRRRPDGALVAAMRRHGRARTLATGERLFSVGDEGHRFYLLEEGTIRLDFPGEKDPIHLEPGSIFGELGLILDGHRRTADATAASPARLVELGVELLPALVEERPREVVELLRSTAAYLLRSEQTLVEDLRQRQRELEATLDYLRRTREELDAAQITAMTDPLTGLYNRRCFLRHVEQIADHGTPAAVLLVDLDRFKEINDTHGHVAGDAVLRHVARVLRETARSTDLPCRVGGDEFAVLLPGAAREECMALATRIVDILGKTPASHEGIPIPIGCSLGGAAFRPGEPWKATYERADDALYRAKRAGRGTARWQD